MQKRLIRLVMLAVIACGLSGCNAIFDRPIDEAVVSVPKVKIRSSTALVALDVAEARLGDRLDILEQAEVRTPTQVEQWYRVRTRAPEKITGWVEASSIINKDVVAQTDALYQKSQAIVSQATGRVKVKARLRLEPNGTVATLLKRGTPVEIVGKVRTTYKPQRDGDDATSGDDDDDEAATQTVVWYEVRLPEAEVLRAGFIGAQQVELDVPEEILHLEGDGRRFTGWVAFDQNKTRNGDIKNNYIALMKGVDSKGAVDFTRILVLNYSVKYERYEAAYIGSSLRGVLPVVLNPTAGRRGFSVQEYDKDGKLHTVEYEMARTDANRLRVTRLAS